MKKSLAAFVLLFLLPATMPAQSGNVRLGFFGGWGLPTAPDEFTDFFNGSFTFGGELRYKTSPRTTLVGRVAYHRFAFDEEGARKSFEQDFFGEVTSFSAEGGNARALAITGNVVQQLNQPGGKASFFVSAGAGL